jgi:hypothetical protein
MQNVYTARDGLEAHYVRDLLEQAGINASVLGESLGAARGDLPMTQQTLPSVWVSDDELERAMKVVNEYLTTTDQDGDGVPFEPEAGEPWTCPSCAERVEGQFAACWNCGAERPA